MDAWHWRTKTQVIWALLSSLLLASPANAQFPEIPAQDLQQAIQDEDSETEGPADYANNYSEQAMNHFRKGEYTKAIELLTKAYRLSPNNTALINNLAASYIQRGVFYQNTQKDYPKALEDYRQALYYLAYEWPEGTAKNTGNAENLKIVRGNIEGTMKNMNLPISDWKWHLQTAWDLRRKGKLQGALVEYAWATELNPKLPDAWTAQGDIYTVLQKPEKAAQAYDKASNSATAPNDSLYVKLGTAWLQKDNPEKAVEYFNKALALNAKNKDALLALEQVWHKEIMLNPRNMSAHLNLGAVYQQMGRLEDAFAQYQVADRLSPNNPLIKLNLSSLYQAKGQLAEATAMIDAVLQANPGNAHALLRKADLLKQQGKTQESEQFLQKALQSSPDKKMVLEELMGVYKTQGDPQKIKSGWELYTATFPQDAMVYYQAGLALHELKDYEGAIDYYQKAARLKPDLSEAYANLGTALHAVNRDDEAISALKKALQLNGSLEEVKTLVDAIEQQKGSKLILQAAKLHEQGKYADAAKAYEAALKQQSKDPDLHANYGLSLQALKRYPEAMAAYNKAIGLAPNTATYYYYLGTAYDAQNQLGPAQKQYEKALNLDPNLEVAKKALDGLKEASTEVPLAKALEAYNKKQYAQALQLIDQVIKADPNNAMAYYYRGLVYDAQKKLDPARMAYEKAISLDNTLSDAVYALAVVLDTQGKRADAKKTYQQFITLMKDHPEDDFIKYAKERLSAL